MPGHIDVRQDDDQLGPHTVVELAQGLLGRAREVHHILALANLAAETLAEQLGHVRLVVDNHDADAHISPSIRPRAGAVCRRTVNSVKDSGSLSTSMEPPCCLRDDVVTDREPKTRAFSGGLGGKKRLE